jgi:predicted HicB family RNase H-like nuclease
MATILEAFMQSHEKRITQLPPVRCTDTLLAALNELAARDERSLSEYVRRVLERHVWGMAATLPADQEAGK